MSEVKIFPVEKEYVKNPDISPEDIRKLREWLKTQPHLPEQYITDLDLILTYHCCEKSSEVTKQVLDLHFTLRTLFTGFFKDRCINKRTELTLNTVLYAILPTPTTRGYKATYVRLIDPDPHNFCFTDAVRTYAIILELWQYEQGTWPGSTIKILDKSFKEYSFELIIDFDTATISHLAKVDLMPLRQLLYFLQEAMLVKLMGVHFINAPSFVDKLMIMLKPFLKKKLLDTIWIHQRESSTLYEYIPKASLPKNCGGEYEDFDTIRDELIAYLKSNSKIILEMNKRTVKEELREGKKTTVEELFGIAGSFKKLDID